MSKKKYYKENEVDPMFLSEAERKELAEVFKTDGFLALQQGINGNNVFGQCVVCSGRDTERGIIIEYDFTQSVAWIGLDGLQHLQFHHKAAFDKTAKLWYKQKEEGRSALRRLLESKL